MRPTTQESTTKRRITTLLQDTTVFSKADFYPEAFVEKLLEEECSKCLNTEDGLGTLDGIIEAVCYSEDVMGKLFDTYAQGTDRMEEQCIEDEEKTDVVISKARTKMNKLTATFKSTEESIESVAQEVMQSGQRLLDLREEVTRMREALNVLILFNRMKKDEDFKPSAYDVDPLDVEFVVGIRKLKMICKELFSEDLIWVLQNVGDYHRHLLEVLQKRFEKGFEEKDFNTMQDAEELLYYLNGGSSAVEYYIDNNAYLNDEKDLLADETLANETHEVDYTQCLIHDQRVLSFLKRVIQQIQKEARDIERVFVQKENVMELFVKQVFIVRIQNFLDVYMHEAVETNEEYLFKCYDAYDQLQTYLTKVLENTGISSKFINEQIGLVFHDDIEEFVNKKEHD